MPAPEDTRASRAGPASQQADVDIGALYATLQREVERNRGGGRDGRARLRDVAERYWAVTAERPLERRPGLKGAVLYPAKRLLRPLLRWYIEPLAFEQRMFNDAALRLIDELWNDRWSEPAAAGPGEERDWRSAYAGDFGDAAQVLDVQTRREDAESYLETFEDGSLGGIFMGRLAEYLPLPALVRTLALAVRKLRAHGVLVAEAINPLSPLALRTYFADPTRSQPLVPETFERLVRQAGFASIETRFLEHPPRPDGVAGEVADILFAPLDYALIARA
jgi:hypothetical protein